MLRRVALVITDVSEELSASCPTGTYLPCRFCLSPFVVTANGQDIRPKRWHSCFSRLLPVAKGEEQGTTVDKIANMR
jgi:hypothetical protein